MMSENVPAIYGQLRQVMIGLANIPKNGDMSFGATKYKYLRADDVQEKLNPLLTEHGIIVKSDYDVETLNRGRGEGAPFVYVNLTLTYISVEDGSTLEVTAVGESAASDDKSINKALTQAIKNTHRATFQFASGEPEPDDIAPKAEGAVTTTPAARKIATATAKVQQKALAGDKGGDTELKALQDAVRAVISDPKKPYTSDDVNKLGLKYAKAAGKEKFVQSDKTVLKVLVEALDKGEVA